MAALSVFLRIASIFIVYFIILQIISFSNGATIWMVTKDRRDTE